MAKRWTTSKKYPGVKWRKGREGKTYYVVYLEGKKRRWVRVGSEKEGVTLSDAAARRVELVAVVKGVERGANESTRKLPPEPLFGAVAERVLELTKTKKSWRDDASRYRDYLAPRFADKRCDEIGVIELEEMKSELLVELAPATACRCLALFRSIWNRGLTFGLIRTPNPMKGVRMPPVDNSRLRFLSLDEADLLFSVLDERSPVSDSLARASFWSGARLSELTGLRWKDVDLEKRLVIFRETKSGKTRKVPISNRLYRLLEDRKRETGGRPSSLVWVNSKGERVRWLSSAFRRTVDELFNADLPKGDRRMRVCFHSLRISFASLLVEKGAPLTVVRDLLGHSDLKMLERYAIVGDDAGRKAVALLDETS